MSRVRPGSCAALALLIPLWLAGAVGAEPPIEYRLQAAYVSKFLRFVEWPPGSVEAGRYVVGVVGDADFWKAMQALDGHGFGDSRVEARRVRSVEEIEGLQVLVVSPRLGSERTARYLDAASGRPILSVGSADDFLGSGGMIRFVLVEDTLRFEIGSEAAKDAGLNLSSRLLRLARNRDSR